MTDARRAGTNVASITSNATIAALKPSTSGSRARTSKTYPEISRPVHQATPTPIATPIAATPAPRPTAIRDNYGIILIDFSQVSTS
jgi:hypothetical protein